MDDRELARVLVEQSAVLLKNDGGLLPLHAPCRAAFFGRTQMEPIYSGNGSGSVDCYEPVKSFVEACETLEIADDPDLRAFYVENQAREQADKPAVPTAEQYQHALNCGLMYELFGKYHPPKPEPCVPDGLVTAARRFSNTAILILGRDSGGEECDRRLDGDYNLTDSERKLTEQVCSAFPNVVLILNINGLIDLSWTQRYSSVKSILFIGVCGAQGGAALANLLTGRAEPSGKLAFTIAHRYEDYPSAGYFSWDKDHEENILTYESYGLSATANGSVGFAKSPVTVYREDIYAGYRSFDAFGPPPLYPFGHGLSYTRFTCTPLDAEKHPGSLSVRVRVRNTGGHAGQEVVQLYLSARGTESRRAPRELKGFAKTMRLNPGEEESVELTLPWHEFACYQETSAAWVIEAGRYELGVGGSPDSLELAALVRVRESILVQQCTNRLGPLPCNRSKLLFAMGPESKPIPEEPGELLLTTADLTPQEPPVLLQPPDLSGFSDRELAALCVGYGPGVPFAAIMACDAPSTILDDNGTPLTENDHPTGFPGYVSPAVPERGIHSVFYKDGPSGVGGTAWPTAMLLACSYDRELLRRFGSAVSAECQRRQVDIWLAPAVNLHRDPLCGRNFEYWSEDPYLTGELALAVTRGAQDGRPVLACPKHFAANEQETYRRGSSRLHFDAADSIITERAMRELYLPPFEKLVREGGVACVMTAFNKINGVFAGGNRDLCTHILREEWGFNGAVVTDWGDMDTVVDGADAVAAGNDVVMPGGPPVIQQILNGLEDGRLSRHALEEAVGHLLWLLAKADRLGTARSDT